MELLTTEVVVLISHVLYSHGQSIPYLLAIIIIVTLEQGMLLMIMYTTFLTCCGTVQVVLVAIHVVCVLTLTSTNHGSIISCMSGITPKVVINICSDENIVFDVMAV